MLARRTTPNSRPRCRVCRQCLALKRCLPKTTCWMCLGIWQYLASSPFPKTKSWKSVREHGWLNRTSAYTLESKCADSDTLVGPHGVSSGTATGSSAVDVPVLAGIWEWKKDLSSLNYFMFMHLYKYLVNSHDKIFDKDSMKADKSERVQVLQWSLGGECVG